jgi:hypothetical protein
MADQLAEIRPVPPNPLPDDRCGPLQCVEGHIAMGILGKRNNIAYVTPIPRAIIVN